MFIHDGGFLGLVLHRRLTSEALGGIGGMEVEIFVGLGIEEEGLEEVIEDGDEIWECRVGVESVWFKESGELGRFCKSVVSGIWWTRGWNKSWERNISR